MTKTRKKLIETAMPLDPINKASSREKSIRHGHPSTLHLWWSRKPLATCRAVLFAQAVDDPAAWPELFPTEQEQNVERERLFDIMSDLVVWKNSNDPGIMGRARREIVRSIARNRQDDLPATPQDDLAYLQKYGPVIRDPFCGGGSIVLEAQRLGLRAIGSDLNPVAVLITKAICEIPGRFAGQKAVYPEAHTDLAGTDQSAAGLAEDILHYGAWMRTKAWERIGHFYPAVRIDDDAVAKRPDLKGLKGQELTVIAFLWVRTVASPDPALQGAHVPLTSSFLLSTKPKNRAWCEPIVQADGRTIAYEVRVGTGQAPMKTVDRSSGGRCLISGASIPFPYIRAEGQAGRMGSRLMAVVAEGRRGRVFLPPTREMEELAQRAQPTWKPDALMPVKHRDFKAPLYGMPSFGDLFTERQLVALTTFSDLIAEVRAEAVRDAEAAGMSRDQTPLAGGGTGATAYGDAIATYLSLGIDRAADRWSSVCIWNSIGLKVEHTFTRQAIPMIWDYSEANPFSHSTGNWSSCCKWISKVVAAVPARKGTSVTQEDATIGNHSNLKKFMFSTDPPYYDNIGYADLSDYFYVWLRQSLNSVWSKLFSTLQAPKEDELIASPHRHQGRQLAEEFFRSRMQNALVRLALQTDSNFPVTIFYAYKQTETDSNGIVSTGWASFLQAIVDAGLSVTGTWPIRTERSGRILAINTNALASSVVLSCRKRSVDAPITTRGKFLTNLRNELPPAIQILQSSDIAPVDLAQAAVGQGMSVFTREILILLLLPHALSKRFINFTKSKLQNNPVAAVALHSTLEPAM